MKMNNDNYDRLVEQDFRRHFRRRRYVYNDEKYMNDK